ncbi:MAG: hypothetical protein NTV36_00755 [Candidatus Staskawiczbacteria bacterium]|nr:hypothetical protein [Candidatus Staskawiczbacteria bacterium]
MELREVTNKDEWEGFLLQCTEKTFLQSWNWGEFNMRQSQIWRLGVYGSTSLTTGGSGGLVATALVIKVSAKRGTFLFIPHGPIFLGTLNINDKKRFWN